MLIQIDICKLIFNWSRKISDFGLNAPVPVAVIFICKSTNCRIPCYKVRQLEHV
uniref:Uncharacterized protein n=1 Tax=Kalanchoe fedtschenkoi TaxID=63787 RepID=A0A7N0V3K2_KALFE